MKMNKTNRSIFILFIALAVFFVSLFVAHSVETSGYKVDVNRLSIETNEGATLSGKMWRPNNASESQPAPAIILVPGGNANLEYMSSMSLELARRGYVTLAIDPYTIGRSDVIEPTADLGASSALAYIKQLSFVDTDAIGMVGWSAGVGRMNAAAINEDGTPNGVKALFAVGAGRAGDPALAINQGYFIGNIETTYGFGIEKQKDINTASAFTEGFQTDYVDFGVWYGDLENSQGRILYTGTTGHIAALVSKSGISSAMSFFDEALAPAPNSQVNNLTYTWKEFGTALAMVALFVAMVMVGKLLLMTPFFNTLRKPRESATSVKPNITMWVMLAVTVVFGALIAKWAVFNGQQYLNKTVFLQIANANGFIFWLLCLSVFSLVLLVARALFDKSFDKNALRSQLKTSFPDLAKSLLLGFIVIVSGYFLVSIGDQLLNISPRFWKVQLNILNAERFGLWLTYLPFYLIPMLIFSFILTSSYYMKDRPKLFTFLVWASYTLPALAFVIYIYGTIISTGLTPITNAAMSRANGTMLDALFLMIPISYITAHFFRKTRNLYIAGFLNAMIFAWIAVGTDLITFIG